MDENKLIQVNNSNNLVKIDLGRLMRAIIKKIWLVILLSFIVGTVVFLVDEYMIDPTYRSYFTAYVNNHSQSVSEETTTLTSGDTNASQSLAYTYATIMSCRSVLVDAAEEAGLDYEYQELEGFVSTEVPTDTQLVNIYVTMKDPDEAYKLAKAIESVASDFLSKAVEGSSMEIITEAEIPSGTYTPRVSRNTAYGVVLGALIAIIGIIIQELTDTRFKSEDQLTEMYGILSIGSVPDFESAASGRSKAYGYGYYSNASSRSARKEKADYGKE